jgi:tetratricopeptide (TPR) repeat protein
VFRYKGKEADPLAIGRELNVDAVLLGRVSERSGHLLIGVELVEARKGWHLWGEKYSRDAADLSTVEGELAADICRKLHVKLTGEQQRRMVRRPTADPRAYWDYLKGRYYANKLTAEGLERGIDYFQEAIREDPDCALAHAGLAASYNLIGFFGLLAPRQVFQKARAAARRALELDDGLAEAHAVMASVRKVCDWDWAGAQAGYRRALELNPNYATAHHWYADFLSAMGRCEEALAEIQLAQELDPLSLLISVELAWNSYMARQFDRSLDHALKTLEMEAALPAAHLVRGLACEQKGRWEEAIEAFGQARDGSGGNPATLAGLGHALARTGHGQEARVILDQLAARRQRGYASPYCSAIVAAGLGDADRALQLLEDAYDQHDFWLVWLAREPRLDGIHSDRRFRNLLARIGLS